MSKHKLLELQKVIEEKIGSLKEEVEIGTNVKLNPLYIADCKDEIEFLLWIVRIIQPILNRDNISISIVQSSCLTVKYSDRRLNLYKVPLHSPSRICVFISTFRKYQTLPRGIAKACLEIRLGAQ